MRLRDLIHELLESTELSNKEIAEKLDCSSVYVSNIARLVLPLEKHQARKNRHLTKMGENNNRYKGGINIHGYRIIYRPDWYTGVSNIQVEEHAVVAAQSYDLTQVPSGYMVHHINCNKLDNDPSNLVLVTKSQHSRIHYQLDKSKSVRDPSRKKHIIRIAREGPPVEPPFQSP